MWGNRALDITSSFIVTVGVSTAFFAAPAAAEPDPLVPQPPSWCPGNPPGAISASGYGGYCEGKSFPDGTRLNAYAIGMFWQPMRCIIPNGSMTPPLAPPGGCGGIFG
jgi:hypothetical protein